MAHYMHSAHIRHLSMSAAVFFSLLITFACLPCLPQDLEGHDGSVRAQQFGMKVRSDRFHDKLFLEWL